MRYNHNILIQNGLRKFRIRGWRFSSNPLSPTFLSRGLRFGLLRLCRKYRFHDPCHRIDAFNRATDGVVANDAIDLQTHER